MLDSTDAPAWQPMSSEDLPAVAQIAAIVHPTHPEDAEVAAERLRLYPAGCLVLCRGTAVIGYALSHPWRLAAPPPLNSALGRLPAMADTFYLHDLALLPAARGRHAGRSGVSRLLARARADGFVRASLVAVSGSVAFWQRQGFAIRSDPAVAAKLASYGADARFMVRELPSAAARTVRR
ncbi:MAG: GNAT family N-acetyltransferase [Acetobacteraceae bacterium]